MTCIVGIADGKNVWIGGDSWAGNAYDGFTIRDSKVFKLRSCLIGYTDSFRMGQLLQFRMNEDIAGFHLDQANDIHRYMATTFVDEVRRVMRDNGCLTRENEVENLGTFLVGCRGRLFRFEPALSVLEASGTINYSAAGCGDQLALGAIHAMINSGACFDPDSIIQRAIEAAAYFCPNVRPPITILKL